MPKTKRIWYDVCNDYSLETRKGAQTPKELLATDWSKHIEDLDGVAFGYFGEVLYFLGPEGLEGTSLEEYDLDGGVWE
jgi:hypothetical protein